MSKIDDDSLICHNANVPKFREDLNEAEQIAAVRRHRANVLHDVTFNEWKKTCTRRHNHTIMLRILVHESFRFRFGPGPLSEERKQELKSLLLRVDKEMSDRDRYVNVVETLGTMGMFERREEVTQLVSRGNLAENWGKSPVRDSLEL